MMNKVLFALAFMALFTCDLHAQKSKKKKTTTVITTKKTTTVAATKKVAVDSTIIKDSIKAAQSTPAQSSGILGGLLSGITNGITGSGKSSLTTGDISSGLREALQVGASNAAKKLSLADGFFGNAALKILMPPEAQKIENTLRSVGMGKQVDDAILSMNRAAENASQSATPIFINAIKGMTITDAVGILKGNDTAATSYLRGKTTSQLTDAFKPVIQESLDKVNATSYWSTLMSAYNAIPFVSKVNTDLAGYVTDKALAGMFTSVAQEEKSIRKDPIAQTTDILKKVFGK